MRSLMWMLFWALLLYAAGGCSVHTHLHVDSLVTPAFVVKRVELVTTLED